jgi:hypothetical protein
VAQVYPLASREHFVDDRGVGLRMTWHPDGSVVVFSLWRDERCAATFRLAATDAARMAALLLTAVPHDSSSAGELAD